MSLSEKLEDGIVETYAGVPGVQGHADGHRTTATFSGFWSCSLAPNGGVYIGDYSNHTIRLVDAGGSVTTYAGTGVSGFADGHRRLAQFSSPAAMFLCEDDSLLISDKNNNRIRRIGPSVAAEGDIYSKSGSAGSSASADTRAGADQVITVAGTGSAGDQDGPCATATFSSPVGIVECEMGILVADWQNHRIRLISGGMVSTFAGTGIPGQANGTRLNAMFSSPTGLCVNRLGEVFVADRNNHRLRVIRTNGEVEHFSGSGERGFEDGPRDNARFTFPWALSLSPFGDIIVSDEYNHRIRVVDPNGYVTNLIGTGEKAWRDGHRATAALAYPACTTLSPQGFLYIADRDNHSLRRIYIEMWATEAVENYKKISLLGLKDAESLADLHLPLHAHASWALHSPVIAMRCPQLMNKDVQEKMQKLDVPIEAIDALLHFIYDNHLPRLSIFRLCELEIVASAIEISNLGILIRTELKKRLSSPHTADELLAILKHIVTRCSNAVHLVNLVMKPLRAQRGLVALRLPSISDWISPTDPIFLDVVAKLMGDFPLSELEEPKQSTEDELATELRGLYSQLEALYDRESGNSASSQSLLASSSAQETKISAVTTKPHKGFSNWWEPDFVLKLDQRTFKCHKWIICGRWPFMRDAMVFGGQEAETAMMELPIESFPTPRLLQSFIRYIYTNEVNQLGDEDCMDILRLAREFRLIDTNGKDVLGFGVLLDHCRSKLLGPLKIDTCIETYKRVLELGTEDQQNSVRSFLIGSMFTLASQPNTIAQLESLGTSELIKILLAQSMQKPESSNSNFWTHL